MIFLGLEWHWWRKSDTELLTQLPLAMFCDICTLWLPGPGNHTITYNVSIIHICVFDINMSQCVSCVFFVTFVPLVLASRAKCQQQRALFSGAKGHLYIFVVDIFWLSKIYWQKSLNKSHFSHCQNTNSHWYLLSIEWKQWSRWCGTCVSQG